MPPLIDPFDLSPGNHQKAALYWYCTWFRTIYRADAATWLDQLLPMVGGVGRTIFPEVLLPLDDRSPRIEIANLAGGRAVANFRGTTATGQLLQQILRSTPVASEPWEGRVLEFHAVRTHNAMERIVATLPAEWMACGHSFGGSMAGLASVWEGCQGVVTAGQPREGDATYAASRSDEFKLRLFNWGDGVPKLPLSTNTFLDFVPGALPGLPFAGAILTYRHWGTPLQYLRTGRISQPYQERSSASELSSYLIGLAADSWNLENHFAPAYVLNVRRDIPVRFPAQGPDFQFPGVFELDQINFQLNEDEGIEWPTTGRDSANLVDLLRQFVGDVSIPSITDLIEHTSIEPFTCED